MGRVLVTGPVEEPITLEEAKLHLRVDEDLHEEDGLIDALIRAARVHVENETGRALLTQTWRFYLDVFPRTGYRDTAITLPMSPVQSVTHVKYYNESDVLTTLSAASYVVDLASDSGRILSASTIGWPSSYYRLNAVEVEAVVGWTNVSLIPPTLKAAMKLLIGIWYEQREGVVVGTSAQKVPDTVDALLAPHRILAVA